MRRTIFAAMAAAMALVLGVAAPASAKWEDARNPEGSGDWFVYDAKLRGNTVGYVRGAGTADNTITWKIQIKCPKGKQFLVTGLLEERDNPAVPEIMGDDGGIPTTVPDVTGTCTGGMQNVTLVGTAVPFTACNSYPPDWEVVCTDYPAGMIEGGYRSNAVAILGELGFYDGTYGTHRDGAFWAEYIAHHANAGPISAFPTWVAKKKK